MNGVSVRAIARPLESSAIRPADAGVRAAISARTAVAAVERSAPSATRSHRRLAEPRTRMRSPSPVIETATRSVQ
jgi:hypothetical protein